MGDSPGDGKVLDIKTADLKSAAPVFHEQAVKLGEALTKLVTTLDGLGEPWGKDDAVKEFATEYPKNQKAIEQATGTLILGLVSIHEAMVDMADGHVDNDALIAGMFNKKDPKGAGDHGKGTK
ncbi:hypothetical protein AF335_02695 [Streptomyces eurocidicus]|uniref:Uncharacterized protein YukE n=1 Tax=Streptomyces eurocidicus TaxID=66423 RepID=A0A2N8P2P8_STREU|nr:hypothetical protein [Streptomyces eurocidicus]MBB5117435.1 uncharacterized protein YukE [Streptomyces eurocidicus]MBF6053279.1 hypothetical protein [Streptomyces eurocidicus]PNE35288.1 hypothetical protein AF335_02695 [Streptomyces eurocidicus]